MKHTVEIEYMVTRDGNTVKAHDRGVLSDEHSASSYGIPVLVWRGTPYGTADMPAGARIRVIWRKARTGPVWSLIQRAINAGYPIEIDPVG